MRVYLESPPTFSRAMFRVADALRSTAPSGIKIVHEPGRADRQIVHAIDSHPERRPDVPYAVIQYCVYSARDATEEQFNDLWGGAVAVWSYYDIAKRMPHGAQFYHAPLGVAGDTFKGDNGNARYLGVVTSGYVSGPGAEAIEEVANAALMAGISVFHLGPEQIEGMDVRRERSWRAGRNLSDEALAGTYSRARWVSGLRHVEGFELPVIEGLACGARPIVFDRPDMRQWYDGFAEFVPECSGRPLVSRLAALFERQPRPVTPAEREAVLARFDWRSVASGFWREVLR